MSAVRELIETLVSAGMEPAEAAAMVTRAAMEMATPTKSAGAIRQQRYRERNKASQSVTPLRSDETSQSVTKRNESVTRDDASLSIEDSLSKKERGTPPIRVSRGSRIATDWVPSPDGRSFAKGEGFSDAEVDREVLRFRDHWLSVAGAKGVKLDWDATWRNWVRRGSEFGGKSSAPTNVASSAIDWESQVSRFARGQAWSTRWYGPEPGQVGCRAPPEVLAKHGFGQAA